MWLTHQRRPAKAWRYIPLAAVIAAMPQLVIHAGAADAAAAHPGLKPVTYLGYSFKVPRSWPVINLGQRSRTCVRFNRHAVYLGAPSPDQKCPSSIVGTTEAILISPASRHKKKTAVEDPVARRITATAPRLRITATFDSHPAVIRRILATAGLPKPVADPPSARPAGGDPLSPQVANYHGFGFDTCAAPSEAVMHDWWVHSPYGAIGIYIGGSDAACAQPNLTPSWLAQEHAQGWHFIPMYVGPQAAFGELHKWSGIQGAAAAADAALHARQLGFGPLTPIYYDMEGYGTGQSARVLRFVSAWTKTLHALGYRSGVYSSALSGISDLAKQYSGSTYAMPDVIYDARWNGQANTSDPVLPASEWVHRRVHQYNGNVTQIFGGQKIDIDQDFLDVRLPIAPPPSPATVNYPAGAAATSYIGRAFDTCQAPSLATMKAWGKSPYRAIGVYIGGVNRACSERQLTASWVTAVSNQHWRLLPVYVGLQPACFLPHNSEGTVKASPQTIRTSAAASEGKAAADDAVARAQALGMRPGSAIYDYLTRYSQTNTNCRNGVLSFVSAWTAELHRRGFVAGIRINYNPGARDLSGSYPSGSFGRPDALWVIRADGNRMLGELPGIPDNQWAVNQRARQYLSPHNERYGGVTMRIGTDNVNVPTATVAYTEKVTSPRGLNARTGPGTSYRVRMAYPHNAAVQVVCQAPGSKIWTSRVWDKLTTGTYVSDYYLSTPSKTGYSEPIPRCVYPYQVIDPDGINERVGPATGYRVIGQLPYGSLAWISCQKAGMKIGNTVVWDQIQGLHWSTDDFVATPSKKTFSRPIPRC